MSMANDDKPNLPKGLMDLLEKHGYIVDIGSCQTTEDLQQMANLMNEVPETSSQVSLPQFSSPSPQPLTETKIESPLDTKDRLPCLKISSVEDFLPLHRFIKAYNSEISGKPKEEDFLDLQRDFDYKEDYQEFLENYKKDTMVRFLCRHPLSGIYLFFENPNFDKTKDLPLGLTILQGGTRDGFMTESICFLKPKNQEKSAPSPLYGSRALAQMLATVQHFINQHKRLPFMEPQGIPVLKMFDVKGINAWVSVRNKPSLCLHAKLMSVYDYKQILEDGKCEDGIGFSYPGVKSPDPITPHDCPMPKELHDDMVQKLKNIANTSMKGNHDKRQQGLKELQALTLPLYKKRKTDYENKKKAESTSPNSTPNASPKKSTQQSASEPQGFFSYFTLKNALIGAGVIGAGIGMAVLLKRRQPVPGENLSLVGSKGTSWPYSSKTNPFKGRAPL